MFGLLRVPKGYLPPQQQEMFQAHYCGLCHALGRCGFPGLRMATSYDATALALFFSGLSGREPQVKQKPCPFSPWRKKSMAVGSNEVFDFAARASLGLARLKAEDELNDGCSKLKGGAIKLVLLYLNGKAPPWPEFAQVSDMQSAVESQAQPWFDELAYPSSLLLGSLAARAAGETKRDQVLAFKVGENLGRWIYTWDSLWDYVDDRKQGRFNALAAAYGLTELPGAWPAGILDEMDFVLDRCVGEISSNIHKLQLGTQGELLIKLIIGAHHWHKQAYIKEFFQEESAYERIPRTWRTPSNEHAATTGTGAG